MSRASSVVAVALALAASLVFAAAAGAAPRSDREVTTTVTLMATTDLHARVVDWDYLADEPYSPGRGLSRVASLVEQVRADRGADRTLLFDIGDTIQGSSLGAYYALREPIAPERQRGSTRHRDRSGAPPLELHPVATAMNAMGYDAMALGNHEFNFGLHILYEFERQLDAPIVGANVLHAGTDRPAFKPYVMKRVNVDGQRAIRVGVLGLTTPGSAVWDRTHVEGHLDFVGGLETAQRYVPEMRAAGADIVVVAMHAGMGSGSSYGDLIPYPENFGTAVAEQVPGIDVIFPGHSHSSIAQRFITNHETGAQVLVSQANPHGRGLSVADLDLALVGGRWTVTAKQSQILNAASTPENPDLVEIVRNQHQRVVDYVNSPIGTSLEELSMEHADYRDVPAMDFINVVQADAVSTGLVGTPYADLPVLSITAPLNRDAGLPQGDVTVRDIAALYIYENTLRGIVITGAQIDDYLEVAAEYFRPVTSTGPFTRNQVAGIGPTYCFDVVYGLEYDIDLSQPVGERINGIAYGGEPVGADDEFVLAINNYRHDGGCGYPHTTTAPIAYFGNPEIQALLMEWVEQAEGVDPATFASVDWQLVYQGTPIEIIP